MDIQSIINSIASGDNLAAKENIEDVLASKAFDALQGRKQEIAASLFNGQEETSEENDTVETEDQTTTAEE